MASMTDDEHVRHSKGMTLLLVPAEGGATRRTVGTCGDSTAKQAGAAAAAGGRSVAHMQRSQEGHILGFHLALLPAETWVAD